VEGQEARIPWLSGSASVKDGALTLSVVNAHAEAPIEAEIELRAGGWGRTTVRTLTASDIHAHNTFDAPDAVSPAASALDASGQRLRYTFAPASVTVFNVALA